MSIINRLLGSDSDASGDESEPDEGEPWPYTWTEDEVETVQGSEVRSVMYDEDGEVDEKFAGPLARDMVLSARDQPDQPVWVGVGKRNGRHAGIEKQSLLQHTAVYGTTGYGKSTLLTNMELQTIEAGAGCVVIDPKGNDALKLLQMIPNHRLDDVVWIEPGGNRSYATGFNFLDVGVEPDHPMFDTLRENVVADLKHAIGADDYWGPLMDGITSTLIRVSSELPYDFALHDLYYILQDEESRQALATLAIQVHDLGHLEYVQKIAEKEEDDFDAILRRLKDWVENPTALKLTAFRDSPIDFETIVNEGKILVVKMGPETKELKRMTTTAVLRRLWSTIRARDEARGVNDPTPFYLFADEFDIIGTENSGVIDILSRARSAGLGLILSTQYPTRLDQDVQDAMNSNCDTTLSFSPGSKKDSKAAAAVLGMDWNKLQSSPDYHIWMQIKLRRTNEISDAFNVYTLPPFPPRRPYTEAEHILERIVREWGRPQKTYEELNDELLIHAGAGALERPDGPLGAGGGTTPDPNDTGASPVTAAQDAEDIELTEVRTARICKAVYDEAVQTGAEDGFVPSKAVAERIRDYFDAADDPADISHDSVLWDLRDGIPDTHLESEDRREDVYLRCTSKGKTTIIKTGSAASGGGIKHRKLLKDLYDPVTRLGIRMRLPMQDGTDLPDALGTLDDIDALDDLPSPEEAAAMSFRKRSEVEASIRERFREDHPLVARLSDGASMAWEAESSTGDSKPHQTWTNLAEAVNAGQRCLFAVREHVAEKVWTSITENREHHCDWKGDHQRLYNGGDMNIDGATMLRPGDEDQTVWLRDEETGEFILRSSGGDGTDLARFEDHEAVYTDAENYPATSDEIEDTDGWMKVKKPFIAEREFDEGGVPDRDEWDIIVVPSNAETIADLDLYEAGERTPLSDLLISGGQGDVTETPTGRQNDAAETPTRDEDAAESDEDDDSDGGFPALSEALESAND